MSGQIISGLIRSEEPLSDQVSIIRRYDPESAPPRLISVEMCWRAE